MEYTINHGLYPSKMFPLLGSDKDLKVTIIKMLHQPFRNILEINEKNRKFQQSNRKYKKKLNGKFRTEEYNHQNKKLNVWANLQNGKSRRKDK